MSGARRESQAGRRPDFLSESGFEPWPDPPASYPVYEPEIGDGYFFGMYTPPGRVLVGEHTGVRCPPTRHIDFPQPIAGVAPGDLADLYDDVLACDFFTFNQVLLHLTDPRPPGTQLFRWNYTAIVVAETPDRLALLTDFDAIAGDGGTTVTRFPVDAVARVVADMRDTGVLGTRGCIDEPILDFDEFERKWSWTLKYAGPNSPGVACGVFTGWLFEVDGSGGSGGSGVAAAPEPCGLRVTPGVGIAGEFAHLLPQLQAFLAALERSGEDLLRAAFDVAMSVDGLPAHLLRLDQSIAFRRFVFRFLMDAWLRRMNVLDCVGDLTEVVDVRRFSRMWDWREEDEVEEDEEEDDEEDDETTAGGNGTGDLPYLWPWSGKVCFMSTGPWVSGDKHGVDTTIYLRFYDLEGLIEESGGVIE